MHQGVVHKQSAIQRYIDSNELTRDDCKIFDGHRLQWNDCHKEWDHAVISSCSTCGKDMTAIKHGKMKCGVTLADGCPDKGDGGW